MCSEERAYAGPFFAMCMRVEVFVIILMHVLVRMRPMQARRMHDAMHQPERLRQHERCDEHERKEPVGGHQNGGVYRNTGHGEGALREVIAIFLHGGAGIWSPRLLPSQGQRFGLF